MDYREMSRLASNPPAVRAMATMIAKLGGDTIDPRMQGLLEDLARYDGSKPLSIRQLEALDALRERTSISARVGPYRAAELVRRAWELRLDLVEDEDEAWLDALHAKGPSLAMSRSEAKRLLAICRRLDVLPSNEWVDLG